MKLTKGLQTDTNEQDQPSDSYIWALNWVANQKVGSLVSERGFQLKHTLTTGFKPLCIMPTADKVVIFSTDGVDSEIGIYDEVTELYTPRLNNAIATSLGGTITGLNFNLLHQIKAIYRFNAKGDLEVAFTDWFNPPRIVTLTNVLADMADYYTPYNINKLNIFQTALFNKIDTEIQTSGNIPSDAYFVFYRYKNVDQTVTNTYVHPEPQYIIIDNSFDDYKTITGNDVGGTTNKSIKVTFGVLDSTFPLVEIGLYRVSTAEAKVISTVPTNQLSATMSSFEGTVIQPSEVISPRIYYSRAKTLSSLNDIVYLGNLEKDTLDVPQKYINSLQLRWTCRMIDPAKDRQNKDYNIPLKTFMANEVYSFVIRFRFKNGSYSDWKHIPGRKAITNRVIQRRDLTESPTLANPAGDYILSKTLVNQVVDERGLILNAGEFSNYKGKVFQTIDTCAVGISATTSPAYGTPEDYFGGAFGYWENDNEAYEEYFTGEDTEIWNAVGNTGAFINNSGHDKVRHHKFPSLNFIEKQLPTVNYPGPNSTFTGPDSVKKVAHFANSFPQFGVQLDQFTLNNAIPADLLATIVDYELGYSARDFNNCTVYGQDLSLFGVYTGIAFEDPSFPFNNFNYSVYLRPQATKDAIYFTGSNSVGGGNSSKSTCAKFNASGNLIAPEVIEINQAFPNKDRALCNWTHAPMLLETTGYTHNNATENQIPNRQRIHTPDLVDPLFPVKNPAIAPTHIRHEVMIVTGQKEILDNQSVPFNAGKNLYITESTDGDYTGNNNYNLIDYCGELNRGVDSNKNTSANYSTFCLKNIPDAWVHRNIKASGYVPKTTKGVIIGDGPVINAGFNYHDGGGDLYGGSDHYHIQLFDKYFDRPGGLASEQYAYTTNKVLALYSSFLTKRLYSGAGINPSSNSNVPTFYNRHPIPSLNFCRTQGSFQDVEKHHHAAFLCSLQKYTTSIYNKFYNIPVINTLQNPNEAAGIFTGDCFISEVQYVTHGANLPKVYDEVNNPYVGQNFTAFRFYAHTRKNLDYRFEKPNTVTETNKIYPASKWNVNFIFSNIGSMDLNIFYTRSLPDIQAKNQAYQTLNYNSVFGTQPTFNVVSNVFSNQSTLNDVSKFPFRVHASEKQAKESQINNWRVFLALNYHENDKTKGEITNLQGYDDQLLIHTVQSLFVTRDRGNLQSSDLGITIGTGGIFDFPPKEAIYDNLGYTGTQHQFGCTMTKLGYVFPDAQQGKYFIYNKSSGIIELSNVGMFNFFKQFGKGTHNDYSNSEASGLSAWNACFDEYNGRVLIGYRKRDKPEESDPKSFTISYSDAFKSFTSFHSYFPYLLANTRKNVYSFNDNKFYKHNTPNKGYYTGVSTRNEIDLVFNTTKIQSQKGLVEGGKEYTKLWQSFNWQSELHSYTDSTIFNLKTFTQASVRTKKQCSDLRDLIPFTNTRLFDSSWYFNDFRDRLDRTGLKSESFAAFVEDLNSQNLITYPNNTNFNSRFIDTYVILRLIYNEGNLGRELHLISLDYTNKPVKK